MTPPICTTSNGTPTAEPTRYSPLQDFDLIEMLDRESIERERVEREQVDRVPERVVHAKGGERTLKKFRDVDEVYTRRVKGKWTTC